MKPREIIKWINYGLIIAAVVAGVATLIIWSLVNMVRG